MTDELEFARRVAVGAGEIVQAYFGQPLPVHEKGWADPVTAADRAAGAYIRTAVGGPEIHAKLLGLDLIKALPC